MIKFFILIGVNVRVTPGSNNPIVDISALYLIKNSPLDLRTKSMIFHHYIQKVSCFFCYD